MEVAASGSHTILYSLFSPFLNGVEKGALSILRSLSIRDCRMLLPKVLFCLRLSDLAVI